jgi:DNA repair protein RecN (Recombination protein N)
MIDEIQVRNVALIKQATLSPSSGMTVLTGETGAGKTALLSALKLLMGGRADKSCVRDGEASLEVSGRFFGMAGCLGAVEADDAGDVDGAGGSSLCAGVDGAGNAGAGGHDPVAFDEVADELVVTRRVGADGRSRAQIDGRMASVRELAERVAPAVDLCGQHDQQQLLRPATHVGMLDAWAVDSVAELLEEYKQAFAQANRAALELKRVQEAGEASSAKLDEARFTLKRIDEVSPAEGEFEELSANLSRAENAEALAVAANDAYEALGGEGGAIDKLNEAASALADGGRYDEELAALSDSLREVGYVLEDVSRSSCDFRDGIDFDVGELVVAQERMSALQGLIRAYGPRMEDVFAAREAAADLVSLVDDAGAREREAQKALDVAEQVLAGAAEQLHEARAAAGPAFAEAVTGQMGRLEMAGAELLCRVDMQPRTSWTAMGPSTVEFEFRPGVGMQPRPLARIASGGEVSRVMLAMKVVLGQADNVDTLVFDEVDAGVGGSTANALAEVLADLAKTHQVIVVTHLAQVAVRAQAHYVVSKVEAADGKPETHLSLLEQDERPTEIARMLSGDATEASLAHAREMLEAAKGVRGADRIAFGRVGLLGC